MHQLLKQRIHKYAYPLVIHTVLAILVGCSSTPTENTSDTSPPAPVVVTQPPPAYTLSTPVPSIPNQIAPSPRLQVQVEPEPSFRPSPRRPRMRHMPQGSLRLANELLQQGQKAEAAQMYHELALTYPSPQRERVLLQAAEITASMGDARVTRSYLAQANNQYIGGESLERLRYIKALLAVQTGRPDIALSLLPDESTVGKSPALQAKIQHVRNKAMALMGNANVPPQPRPPQAQPQAPRQEPVIPNSTARIAVLLPRSGSLGAVSNEIFQGIQLAQAQTGNDTRIKLYDISTGVLNQYRAAVAEGADLIIGPLDKDNVVELLRYPQELSKPILALNYLEGNASVPSTLYQFGLSPEDEAIQVARTALHRGHQRAVVMVPDSAWGARLEQAFKAAYQAGGGQIVSTARYPNTPKDYLAQVQRHVTNRGAQMVFLAASPTQARLMRPLLQAQAGLLPVYATSHIFSGRLEPRKDADLDGIIYTEIPWILENSRSGALKSSQYPRMYALGIDAFLVAKNLQGLVYNQQALRGRTGQIQMRNQKVQRTLGLATFVNGEPSPLE
ncbi:penicillin-binding protein activator [Thiofilum flexile]|uniref:penicillin-binding protein activator n=1 Tax=Thiofilum flexile TaxID=125627 RepID=UPI00036033B7|nr:penicillin-binding protein activator [Thiofilum flexile]